MTTEHIKNRRKLKSIANVADFQRVLEQCVLSDEDKKILKMHYISEKDFRYIADTLGYCESTIKNRHKKAIKKIGDIL